MRELRNADALAAHVELPSVVQALEAPVDQPSVRKPRGAVGTSVLEAAKRPLVVAEENEAIVMNRERGWA